MADKQAITEILNRAGVAYDVADVDFLSSIFTDDGLFEMTIAGGDPIRFEGGANIRKLFADSLQEQDDQRRHVITNIYFASDAGDAAQVVSYLVLITVKDGALTVLSSGMYTDDFVLDGGEWKIRKRLLELDLPY